VAGHGPANGKVALLAGEKVIGDARTEDSGDFVIVPEPLAPGNYVLSLRSGAVRSSQSVTVSVPAKGNKQGLVVALNQPGKPSVLLADPTANEAPPKTTASSKPAVRATAKVKPTVAFKTAEADKGGFYASGLAPAGTHVRIYLNGSALADVIADSKGHWSLTIGKGMTAGHYVVRADAVDKKGKVVARAEVPFDMPVVVAEDDATATKARPAAPRHKPAAAAPPAAVASLPAPQPKAPAQAAVAKGPKAEVVQPAVIAKSAGMAGQRANAQEGEATSQTKVAATPKPVETPAKVAEAPQPVPDASHAMVAEVNTAKVVHGDSLWRISRETLGHGVRYTLIYQANAAQIRNPNLIYPGQVFVVPHVN
jgi:nucleoid-associated protein YgaU